MYFTETGRYWDRLGNTWEGLMSALFGMTGNPVADFFIGTFLAALLATVIGELTISIVYLANRNHLENTRKNMAESHNRSMDALRAGNKKDWRVHNKEANDAFGKFFFNSIAMGAAMLWPCFFILAWMQTQYLNMIIPIPFTGWVVNYIVVFLICYILARILFNMVRPTLPYFKRIQKMLDASTNTKNIFQ